MDTGKLTIKANSVELGGTSVKVDNQDGYMKFYDGYYPAGISVRQLGIAGATGPTGANGVVGPTGATGASGDVGYAASVSPEGDGSILISNPTTGPVWNSRMMPGDQCDVVWIPCDDYGCNGTNQIVSLVEGLATPITMTVIGATGRQNKPGLFTRAISLCSASTDLPTFSTLTEYTVSAWINVFATPGAASRGLIALKDNNNNSHGLAIGTPNASDRGLASGSVYLYQIIQGVNYPTFTYNTDRDAMLPIQQWSHVAATYQISSGAYNLYINGQSIATGTQSTTGTGFFGFNSLMDSTDGCYNVCDIRVCNVRRDESYFLEQYQRGMGRFDYIPYRNTENIFNINTENPTRTIFNI
jgi:hypothetical protein